MAVDLIKAIAELLGAIAWPIAIVVAAFVLTRRHQHAMDRMIDRIRTFTLPGGAQIDLDELRERQEDEVAEKMEQIAEAGDGSEEALRAAAAELAEAARALGRIEAASTKTGVPLINAFYRNPDGDPRGPWRAVDMTVPQTKSAHKPELLYTVTAPSGREIQPPRGRTWRFSQQRFRELETEGRVSWGTDGDGFPRHKVYLSELQENPGVSRRREHP
jgi:hypothetical protein